MEFEEAIQEIKRIINENKSIDILEKCVNFLYNNFTRYNWIGIYIVKDNNLILGPWAGKQATEHTKIPIGTGICGSAAKSGKTEVISNVIADNRYLSCFLSTKSEIVVPIKKNNKIVGEIDIDSDTIDAFNKNDANFLEKVAELIANYIE